jgi:hypothetical protein
LAHGDEDDEDNWNEDDDEDDGDDEDDWNEDDEDDWNEDDEDDEDDWNEDDDEDRRPSVGNVRRPAEQLDQTVPVPLVRPEAARARDAALIAPLPSPPEEDEDDWFDEPDAVLPQPAQTRRARQSHQTERSNSVQPGHLICGDCGQGNVPTRRFCSRCGSELDEAEVAKAPWWHKLRPRRGPRVVALGSGTGTGRTGPAVVPGQGRQNFVNKVKVIGGVLLCLSCLLYAMYAPFRNAVDRQTASIRAAVKGFVESQYSPVRPSKVSANKAIKGHGPENTKDLNTASYWSARYASEVQSLDTVTLNVEFDSIVQLDQLIITPGVADAFTDHGRPRLLILRFTNEKTMMINVKDSAKPQKFDLSGATGIKSVSITIGAIFPSEKNKDVAISELEFFSLLS